MTLFMLVALVGSLEMLTLVAVLGLQVRPRERRPLDFRPEVAAEERAMAGVCEPARVPRHPLALPGWDALWVLGPPDPGG